MQYIDLKLFKTCKFVGNHKAVSPEEEPNLTRSNNITSARVLIWMLFFFKGLLAITEAEYCLVLASPPPTPSPPRTFSGYLPAETTHTITH